ncbi:TPA: gluconokinase [Enterococcus faecalis]|uniref:gluconokinase n=1 Tax=Enterococcus faecalis TaxID=1351 RepID=UPI0011425F2C|nr:gluconokinase [Enterococcus faecalis]EHV0153109.1 gluconokinase [Enterococcus faecalis]NSV46484.1 gluconokinase [Enterococcus faecalis]TQA42746.1 gluconokinase [Enterococcus faecalis]HDT8171234.1 gluconokinase [Enterococcus faecalis]
MKKFIIGVDIGTTSTKAVLYDTQGNVNGYANKEYPLYQDIPDMAEQDPDEIFEAVIEVLTTVVRKSKADINEITGVSFSSAMHSLILLDGDNKLLTRCITWADNRSFKQADTLKNSSNGLSIYHRTGTPIHPMSPLSKILWLKEEYPELIKKTAHFIGIKEYVFYKLFGQFKIDISIASATGLFNINDLSWDNSVLELLDISTDQLSELVETNQQIVGLKESYAEVIGISTETPFIVGASDGCLSNLGVNAIDGKTLALTIGTSGAVRMVSNKPVTDKHGRTFCYALTKDKWVIGGPVNNGGIVFRWVRDQLFAPEKITAEQMQVDSYEILTQIAEKIPAGSDGLLFHPFLGGERAPLWDANAKGSFIGLTTRHTRAHMVRAALEGIVFNLYSVMLILEELVERPQKIHATGGFARSSLWRQLLADIFEQDVSIPESYESSCLGAAVLAMESLGLIESIEEVSSMIGVTNTHVPNEIHFPIYRELLPIFIRTTRLLQNEFKDIADFQRKYTN